MANIVLNIPNTRNTQSVGNSTPTYKDISMVSKHITQSENTDIYSVESLKDLSAIKNSIHNIFSWNKGERILNPEFGTKLRQLLYSGITTDTYEQISSEIKGLIAKYEPRVEVESITRILSESEIETDHNVIGVNIVYSAKGFPKIKMSEPVTIDNV